jgi:hypothetical protein
VERIKADKQEVQEVAGAVCSSARATPPDLQLCVEAGWVQVVFINLRCTQLCGQIKSAAHTHLNTTRLYKGATLQASNMQGC